MNIKAIIDLWAIMMGLIWLFSLVAWTGGNARDKTVEKLTVITLILASLAVGLR